MNKVTLFVLIGLIIISSIGIIAIYNDLPEQIPGQFGFDGEVNRYDDKSSILFTASMPLIMIIMMYVLPKIDPKKSNYVKHKKAYAIITITLVIFFIAMQWVIIGISMGHDINIGIVIKVALGILFIIMGNYMSQFRQNYFLGIKTPWTLASEYVWRKTHRVGAYCFLIDGVIIIMSLFIKNQLISKLIYILIMVILFIPVAYSYFEYIKLERTK